VTLEQLLHQLERRADDAAAVGATAPLEHVYRQLMEEVRQLAHDAPPGKGDRAKPDRMLKASEVCERLGLSERSVYKNAPGWPFTRRYPSGSVRFSEQGLEKWIARRR